MGKRNLTPVLRAAYNEKTKNSADVLLRDLRFLLETNILTLSGNPFTWSFVIN